VAAARRHPIRAERAEPRDARSLAVEPTVRGARSIGEPLEIDIPDGDATWLKARALLDSYYGIIFVGPPGTGKSYYARQVAAKLVDGDSARVRFIQFHPSYQYEDFVQGYVPKRDADGYELKDKHLVEMAEQAGTTHAVHVIVIDELSRGDPARIFGEALTYVEKTKRGLTFALASGKVMIVPKELRFITTMNPLDRGVDEVDAAFDRRFAKLPMEPDAEQLRAFLEKNRMLAPLRERMVQFFLWLQRKAERNEYARIGHAYFLEARDETDLSRLWDHQLQFVFEKAYRHSRPELDEIKRAWDRAVGGGGVGGDGADRVADAAARPAEAAPVSREPEGDRGRPA